jgi:hypothetical protein
MGRHHYSDTSANPDYSGDTCGEQGDTCGVKCCGDGENMISCPDFDSADTTDTFMQSLSAQCAQAYAEQGRPWIPSTNVVCASTSRQLSYLDAAGIAGGYLALIDGIITMLVIVIYLLGTCQRPADIIAAAKAVNRSETDDLQAQMDELVPIIEKFTGYRWDAAREKFDTPTEGAEDRDAGDEEQPLRNKYELRPEIPPRTHSGFKRLDSPGSKRVTAQQVAQRLENELKPIKMQADRLESANRKLMAAVRQLEIKDVGVRELPAHHGGHSSHATGPRGARPTISKSVHGTEESAR